MEDEYLSECNTYKIMQVIHILILRNCINLNIY